MSASRKLYQALAEKYKGMRPHEDAYVMQWLSMCVATALVLREDNSSFQKARFIRACGFTDAEFNAYKDVL